MRSPKATASSVAMLCAAMAPMKTATPPSGPPWALNAAAEMKERSPTSAAKTNKKASRRVEGRKLVDFAAHMGHEKLFIALPIQTYSGHLWAVPAGSMIHCGRKARWFDCGRSGILMNDFHLSCALMSLFESIP